MSKPLIDWDKAQLSVGIERIDQQHKMLVGYINELSAAIDNTLSDDIIMQLFSKLYDYTKFHFQDEERYFSKLHKNDCELHRLQHKHFIEELDRIKTIDDIQLVSSDLLYFLTDWIINHIQAEDKKFIQLHTSHR